MDGDGIDDLRAFANPSSGKITLAVGVEILLMLWISAALTLGSDSSISA